MLVTYLTTLDPNINLTFDVSNLILIAYRIAFAFFFDFPALGPTLRSSESAFGGPLTLPVRFVDYM